MSTQSTVPVTPGSGANVATYDITESSTTKKIQRIAVSDPNGADVFGTQADAAAVQTDTTALSWTQIFKQISKSIQAAAASLATLVTNQAPIGQQVVADAATVVPPSDFKAYPKAASTSMALIGTTGASGDWLDGVYIIPLSTSPGAVSYQDGSGSAVTVFAGGSSSVGDLKGFYVPIGAPATTGWKGATGASVAAIFYGKHT